ncbi:hypothetical protein C2S53_020532 [Perilla frutescens var. hirtella]|uniref:DUF4378 domain-containing protein n=1 Tax=Perilla frutescens var. hirtella TaxID=608512 RepID=A0AAD4JA95_PERFH|nr:hypothetical protein C2S53_020532 [Perilla frutescens var. hirtella]
MTTKMVTSSDSNRDLLQKQIGCTNGIFQLFGRRLFFAGRNAGSHQHKRLLPVGAQQRLEPHNATKAVIEKDPELQKERTRESLESSRASYSSSSRSSTCSSLEHTAVKERNHSLNRGLQSPDIRDVVKDSMYREARGVPIKSSTNERVTVMKHIDSPRLLQRPTGTKAERGVLARFSCDERESRDTLKTNMKLKELPRFSLDSKASSMKHSGLESRLNSFGCNLHMENENSCQVPPVKKESGSHSRSSSIVTKLMGLEDHSDSIIKDESSIARIKSSPSPRVAFLSKSPTTAERSQLKQVSSPQSVSRKNPASQSPRQRKANSVRKATTCSKLPLEPTPWKQKDYSQQCQKMARKSGKAPADGSYPSSSVYGEIEKRLTELEFKRSGKDLRALKQILEAMQKTRVKLERQSRESDELKLQESTLEDSCSNQNSSSLMLQNRKTYQQPVLTISETCRPKQLSSSTGTTKLSKVTGKVKISSSSQVPRTQDSKYDRENPAQRERANYCTPMNNNMKDPNQRFLSIDKKITWRNLESEHPVPQHIKVENCTTSGRGCGLVSPRMQHIVLTTERKSHPNTSTSESDRAMKQLSKKAREKCPKNRKHRAKSMDLQLSNDQLSNLSSETRYSSYHGDTASTKSESNNSVASHVETDAISSVNFFSFNSREHQAKFLPQDCVTTPKQQMPAVELTVITMEQPSPVSVLDTPFYSEGSPSPVKQISTAFRVNKEDESPTPDEAEWNLQTLNHLAASAKSDSSSKNNQKSENPLCLIHEPRLSKTKPKETAANINGSAYQSINPRHRYIKKMILASGLLKDTNIIQTDNHILSLGDHFNSNMIHTLQEEDDPNEELIENNDQMKSNQKIQRKIVADVANEILVRKITSGRLFTIGRRRMSLQGIIKEVHMEMEHLCRMSYYNVDDEDDRSIRAVTVDMKYQSDDWTDYGGEVPALVLDIERMIFKDLIHEVITCEVSGLYDWPKWHCRQLFTK